MATSKRDPLVLRVVARQPGELTYLGYTTPLLGGYPIKFGKHFSWAGPAADGKWYNFGGDGGIHSRPSDGGAAKWLRYDPTTGVCDLYYPYYGIRGQTYPYLPDCYMWIHRANGTFVALPGYQWDTPSPFPEVGIPIGRNGVPKRFDYPGGTNGKWTYSSAAQWSVPVSEQNSNLNYCPSRDEAYLVVGGANAFMAWDLSKDTVSSRPAIPVVAASFTRSQQQVYCEETDELFALCLANNGDTSWYTDNLSVLAARCSGQSSGQTRRIWTWDRPPQSSVESGVAGETPVVLVPNRRRLYIFIGEYLDWARYYSEGPNPRPWTSTNTGGIIEISFDSGYANSTWKVIPYPKALRAYTATLRSESARPWAGDVLVRQAYYDPLRDCIWGTLANGQIIFTMKWA